MLAGRAPPQELGYPAGAATYHHIGIYVGGGQMVHAPDFGQTVSLANLFDPYWKTQLWKAIRFG